jgi:hypothetical protein
MPSAWTGTTAAMSTQSRKSVPAYPACSTQVLTQTAHRPLFSYGNLCAKPLLARVLTGDSCNVNLASRVPSRLAYRDLPNVGCDCPAIVRKEDPMAGLHLSAGNSYSAEEA